MSSSNNRVNQRMLLENFIVLKDRAFVFAYVPKVACTNWKSIMRYVNGAQDYLDAQKAHDRKAAGLVYLNTLPPHESESLLRSPDVARYTFIRNPYTRTL